MPALCRRPLLPIVLVASALAGCEMTPSVGRMEDVARRPSSGFVLPAANALNVPGLAPAPMPASAPVEGIPSYGKPYPLPGHTTWITPFVIAREESIFRDPDPFTRGGQGARNGQDAPLALPDQLASLGVRWHNALFTDRASDETWSLLARRGVISRYWLLLRSDETQPDGFSTGLHLFAATVDDTNDDGQLDDKDATVVILTEGDGRDPRPVTPRHLQVRNVYFVPGDELLVFELRQDYGGDRSFSPKDPIVYYKLNLAAGDRTASPWNSAATTSKIESLYF